MLAGLLYNLLNSTLYLDEPNRETHYAATASVFARAPVTYTEPDSRVLRRLRHSATLPPILSLPSPTPHPESLHVSPSSPEGRHRESTV